MRLTGFSLLRLRLFREAKKYRQNADLVKLEDHALDAVTGGTDAFQTVLCRYGLHRPGRQVNECSFVCACRKKQIRTHLRIFFLISQYGLDRAAAAEVLATVGVPEQVRAEALDLAQLARLSEVLYECAGKKNIAGPDSDSVSDAGRERAPANDTCEEE